MSIEGLLMLEEYARVNRLVPQKCSCGWEYFGLIEGWGMCERCGAKIWIKAQFENVMNNNE